MDRTAVVARKKLVEIGMACARSAAVAIPPKNVTPTARHALLIALPRESAPTVRTSPIAAKLAIHADSEPILSIHW